MSGIIGIGVVTPVGLSALASCAALRAGIARITEVAGYTVPGPMGEPIEPVAGRVPLEWMDGGPKLEEWPGHDKAKVATPLPEACWIADGSDRLVRMAALALEEALDEARTPRPPGTWVLLLALADGEPSAPIVEVARKTGWNPQAVEVIPGGRASALAAVHRARKLLDERRADGVVVLAVDSLIRPSALKALDAAGRLRSEARPTAPHPGEGAAALVIAPSGGCRILSSGVGEESTAGTEDPNPAKGLTAALREAQKGANLDHRPLCIGDLNGDRYRSTEWAMAQMRTVGALQHGDADDWTTADLIGDTGAASGAIHLAWAVDAIRRGYTPQPRVLVWGASDLRPRAAVVLEG